jgi:Sulfotransferase domain
MKFIRIAMWSGPRNISTAMMRSWGNRPDTVVVDEPFYAFYLKETGTKHPGGEEVIAQGEIDWRKVVELCRRNASPVEDSPRSPMDELAVARRTRKIFYQKQMTHHLLPGISRDWLRDVTNCFLIRDPAEVIASYIKKNPDLELNDLGFVQQAEIFDFVRRHTASTPPVIDADDVLRDPERMLRLLCHAVGVEFSDTMLSWPPGLRDTDGIWAKYWYAEVERSTGFQRYRERKVEVPDHLREIEQRCRQCYEQLYRHRLG